MKRGFRVFFSAVLTFSLLPTLAEAALVVGVTDQHLDPDHNIVENCFVEALVAAGHVPVVVPCLTNDAALAAIVAKLDALVFTGGADVEPARYRTPRAPKCCDPDLLRDDFEFRLLAAARARRLPIAGICRGCQLINVGFGGTLWQDLPSEFQKGKSDIRHATGEYLHPERHPAAHQVKIVPGTRLASVLGTENLSVNSHHHQAVKKIAPGFRVTAVSTDGVIEGIESTDYPAFCVQFHPEAIVARAKGNAAYDHARMTKFFTSLADLCGTAGGQKDRVVIVPAHPDDLVACLGFCHLAKGVYDIHVIDFTHGERGLGQAGFTNGVARATRTKEEEAVCASIGATLHWLDEVDGESYAGRETCRKLAKLIADIRPRAVIGHWPADIHTDHVMAGAAMQRAVFLSGVKPEVWFFEEPYQAKGLVPDALVDVSSVMDEIFESLRLYACQNQGGGLEREQRLVRRFRGMQSRNYYKGECEAYKAMIPPMQGVRTIFSDLPAPKGADRGFDFEGAREAD